MDQWWPRLFVATSRPASCARISKAFAYWKKAIQIRLPVAVSVAATNPSLPCASPPQEYRRSWSRWTTKAISMMSAHSTARSKRDGAAARRALLDQSVRRPAPEETGQQHIGVNDCAHAGAWHERLSPPHRSLPSTSARSRRRRRGRRPKGARPLPVGASWHLWAAVRAPRRSKGLPRARPSPLPRGSFDFNLSHGPRDQQRVLSRSYAEGFMSGPGLTDAVCVGNSRDPCRGRSRHAAPRASPRRRPWRRNPSDNTGVHRWRSPPRRAAAARLWQPWGRLRPIPWLLTRTVRGESYIADRR